MPLQIGSTAKSMQLKAVIFSLKRESSLDTLSLTTELIIGINSNNERLVPHDLFPLLNLRPVNMEQSALQLHDKLVKQIPIRQVGRKSVRRTELVPGKYVLDMSEFIDQIYVISETSTFTVEVPVPSAPLAPALPVTRVTTDTTDAFPEVFREHTFAAVKFHQTGMIIFASSVHYVPPLVCNSGKLLDLGHETFAITLKNTEQNRNSVRIIQFDGLLFQVMNRFTLHESVKILKGVYDPTNLYLLCTVATIFNKINSADSPASASNGEQVKQTYLFIIWDQVYNRVASRYNLVDLFPTLGQDDLTEQDLEIFIADSYEAVAISYKNTVVYFDTITSNAMTTFRAHSIDPEHYRVNKVVFC